MKKFRLSTIIGTRPEIIRLQAILSLFDKDFDHRIIHTGQNFDASLSSNFFTELGIRNPDLMLNCSNESLGSFLGDLFPKIEEEFLKNRPDAILILGDTNSSLVAIQARRMGIPVYHLEAGNRSFDINVPEEINRKIVDHCSDFNLCYTEHARRNLIAEGLHPRMIGVIGSPLNEVIKNFSNRLDKSHALKDNNLETSKYFLVSLHRAENVDSEVRLRQIFDTLNAIADKYELPILVSTHPRTRIKLNSAKLAFHELISFHEPFGFIDYLRLQKSAKVVISDSGSVSEESAILGFPAITIRNSIERPEAIESGVLILSGIESNSVLSSIESAIIGKPAASIPSEYLITDTAQRVSRFVQSTLPNYSFWTGRRELE
jgi:UDP-N-acetylglucosamine 2-epimerase (non-hydrolysing)